MVKGLLLKNLLSLLLEVRRLDAMVFVAVQQGSFGFLAVVLLKAFDATETLAARLAAVLGWIEMQLLVAYVRLSVVKVEIASGNARRKS
jgi:hypothetical protein